MSEFKTYTLEQLCIVGSSKRVHLSDYVQQGIPFYRSKEVIEISSGKNISEQLFISSEKYSEIKSKFPVPQENDVLITAVGTIGEILVVKDPNFYFKDGNLIWLRNIDFDLIDIDYLYYFFKSDLFQKTIKYNNIGAVQKALTIDFLKTVKITLPSLDNQRKLVSVLKSIDKKIQTNNQIIQELEAMAKTLYDYWFVQFDFPDQNGKPYKSSGGKMVYHPELKREIPEGWGVEKLKDKLSVSRGISYKTENIKDNIGIPMINLASIGISRNYKSSGLKFFNGEYSKEKIVSGGDLLIACTDLTRNADIVGSPIIVPFDEQKYLFSMDLAKIDSKVDYINKYYLYSTLRTEHYHNYIKKWASGTNVLHLNIDGMGWYSIAIPPMNLQEEYSKIILNFSKKTNNNIQQNQELTQLRDWLLPMLMNGQVKV